jgi:hypothetical protein
MRLPLFVHPATRDRVDKFFDDPLGLEPLSPLRSRDPRWFMPAHAAGSFRTAKLRDRALPGSQPAQQVPGGCGGNAHSTSAGSGS